MKPLSCAVIGLGRIGCGFDDKSKNKIPITHVGSYYKNPKTKLTAFCDIDKSKLKKYGKKYDVSGLYTDSRKMFQYEKIDCLSICTHANTHLELIKHASKENIKAIFVEKPISNSISNAKKIIEICKKNKIPLLVDHQRRFSPFYQSIRQYIQNRRFGNLQLINVYYGGGIANTGSHIFDLIRFFFGEMKYIKSIPSRNNSGNALDPNIDVIIHLNNKINCFMHSLDTRNYGILEMDIFGNKGRIKLDLTNDKCESFKISNNPILVYKKLEKYNRSFKNSKKSSIYLGIENLVNCVISKSRSLSSGFDGLKSLEAVSSSIQSLKENKIIELSTTSQRLKINSR